MPQFEDFHYEDAGHIYTDNEGIVRPSITQCLSAVGIFDFSKADPARVEYKKILGSNVHNWTADLDSGMHPDPMELSEEEYCYAQGWMQWVKDVRPEWVEIEKARFRNIAGTVVVGRPDRIARINNRLWVIEQKCCAAHHPGWKLQTALQEMLFTGHPCVGLLGRMAVRLTPDGKYIPNHKPYEDLNDGQVAISIVKTATWMKNNNLLSNPNLGGFNETGHQAAG